MFFLPHFSHFCSFNVPWGLLSVTWLSGLSSGLNWNIQRRSRPLVFFFFTPIAFLPCFFPALPFFAPWLYFRRKWFFYRLTLEKEIGLLSHMLCRDQSIRIHAFQPTNFFLASIEQPYSFFLFSPITSIRTNGFVLCWIVPLYTICSYVTASLRLLSSREITLSTLLPYFSLIPISRLSLLKNTNQPTKSLSQSHLSSRFRLKSFLSLLSNGKEISSFFFTFSRPFSHPPMNPVSFLYEEIQ